MPRIPPPGIKGPGGTPDGGQPGGQRGHPPVTGAEGLEVGNPLLVRLTGKSLLHVPQDGGWRGEIPSWEAEMRGRFLFLLWAGL